MVCVNIPKRLLSLVVFTTLGAAPIASAQVSWKLYDARDLIGLLPPSPRIEASTDRSPAEFVFGATPVTPKPKAPQPGPVDALMDRLCDSLGVDCTALFDGVYGIEGEESDHAVLLSMLESVRELYSQRYDVEIVWFETVLDEAPQIGDPVTPVAPVHRHRLVAARRTPTEMVQLSRLAFVAGVQPVVGTGAMGYSPQIEHAELGLRASILVGAGHGNETSSSIRVRGDLRQVTMGKMSGPVTGGVPESKDVAHGRSVEIELPTVSTRSIRSDIRIDHGKLITLAVVDGFGVGECIVVAASVRRLIHP